MNYYVNRHFLSYFKFTCLLLAFTVFSVSLIGRYDVTVSGYLSFADGLGRLSVGLLDNLQHKLKMNFHYNGYYMGLSHITLQDVPKNIIPIIDNPAKTPGTICILFSPLWYTYEGAYRRMPDSLIKIAYSMFETTRLPTQWSAILNTFFDAVVVPDKYYTKVYKRSGVKIPIFVLPCGLYLEEFLNYPIKQHKNVPFIFGTSAAFWPHKNNEILIEAFAQEFGNSSNVKLIIHSRFGGAEQVNSLKNKYQLTNLQFINSALNKNDYLSLMSSFDVYVLLSKAEGYSVTPREALALGIPCILSRNTAHKTICDTGFVKGVTSKTKNSADYLHMFGQVCGHNFSCNIEDVRKSLREVYENYEYHLWQARKGREWVKQYLYKNLEPYYMGLLKPMNIVLSSGNQIMPNALWTSSKSLYQKYNKILNIN